MNVRSEDSLADQRRRAINERRQLVFAGDRAAKHAMSRLSPQQLDCRAGHDAEIGLAEKAVETRANAVAIEVRRLRSWKMTAAGPDQLAGPKDNFKSGDLLGARSMVGDAPVQRVAEDGSFGAG